MPRSRAGITTVFDALGVGEADPDSLRGTSWNGVVGTLENCTRRGLLRAEHLLHVRCELPAPNTVELFAPFIDHPMVRLISLMDHTPGQRQWENIDHARVYYTGKKGWSLDKFERKVAERRAAGTLRTAPSSTFRDLCTEPRHRAGQPRRHHSGACAAGPRRGGITDCP